jgi:hypothetical protein
MCQYLPSSAIQCSYAIPHAEKNFRQYTALALLIHVHNFHKELRPKQLKELNLITRRAMGFSFHFLGPEGLWDLTTEFYRFCSTGKDN